MLSPLFLFSYARIKGFVTNYVIKHKTLLTSIKKSFTTNDFDTKEREKDTKEREKL